jgi:hypothetical protein
LLFLEEDHYVAKDFLYVLLLILDPVAGYVLFLEEDHFVAEKSLYVLLLLI